MEESLESIVQAMIIIVVIILCFAAFFYFRGVTIIDSTCYEDIAKYECPGQTFEIYKDYWDTEYKFKCFDYSDVDNDSRYTIDRQPDVTYFVFLDNDHKKCGTLYKYFKEVQ